MNLDDVRKLFGYETAEAAGDVRFFKVTGLNNPYNEAAAYATADIHVSQADGMYYAASVGGFTTDKFTELTD